MVCSVMNKVTMEEQGNKKPLLNRLAITQISVPSIPKLLLRKSKSTSDYIRRNFAMSMIKLYIQRYQSKFCEEYPGIHLDSISYPTHVCIVIRSIEKETVVSLQAYSS